MATTFVQMQTQLQAIGPFSTTTASSGLLKTYLNQGQSWVLAKRRWSGLEVTGTFASVSGQQDYVLVGTSPVVPDFGQMISLRHNLANGGVPAPKLWQQSQQMFDEMTSLVGPAAGPPRFYTIRGGAIQTTSAAVLPGGSQKLSVWPVPAFIGSFTASYFRNVASTPMVADTDLSIVPEELIQAVIWRAAYYALTAKGAMIQAGQFNQMAQEILGEEIQADSVSRAGDPPNGTQPTIGNNLPPSPELANPINSPYGFRTS